MAALLPTCLNYLWQMVKSLHHANLRRLVLLNATVPRNATVPAKPVLDSLVYILARLKHFKCRPYFPQLQNSLVTRHQIFCVCPAASSKNRVWTHSLVKLVCPRICCLQRQLTIQFMWCNSIPQYTPVYPSTPQYTPVYPSTPQYMSVHPSIPQYMSVHAQVFSSIPQYIPVHVI